MPRFDSPSVFGSLLDSEKGGFWSVEPAISEGFSTRQSYLRNTNVLVTTFSHDGGEWEFELVDFAPRYLLDNGMHRPVQLMRVLRNIRGAPRVVVRCRPRPGYGAEVPRVIPISQGVQFQGQSDSYFLTTDVSSSLIISELPFELKGPRHFVFSFGVPFEGSLRFAVEEALERTASHWRVWARQCNIPAEFQAEVLRSALAIKLHIFEDTGAIIAATTTSIPEGPHSGRTWDYRYCWLRDAYFVISALNRLGQFEEIEQFIRFLQNICSSESGHALQPVYGIDGEKVLSEREIPWLRGFEGHGPVRVGNAAYAMEQHDVYGEMVLALTRAFFDQRMHRTDQNRALANVESLVEQAIRCFELPDAGIWEFRGSKQHSVFSKFMNWAAVDRGVRIAERAGRSELRERWEPIRDRMHREIERQGWNELVGYYTQSFGGDSPDAANLLLLTLNFLEPQDERFLRMASAYERILRVGKGVYRYRVPDDFGVPTTTFTVCSFWLADALWAAGKRAEARTIFTSVLAHANPVGLLSEDMEPESGILWGNFPQTYSHVGVINTAWRISKSWDEAF